MTISPSHCRPSHWSPSMIASTACLVDRARSVSSIRSRNLPPWWRAKSQLKRAVRAPPIWRKPVGEGAKRTVTLMAARFSTSAGSRHGRGAASCRASIRPPDRLDWAPMSVSAELSGEARPGLLTPLYERFLAERERWPLWFPVLMGIGVGLYFSLTSEPSWWIGSGALTGASAAMIAAWRARIDVTATGAVLALALGFAAAQLECWKVAAPVLTHRIGPALVTGRLVS